MSWLRLEDAFFQNPPCVLAGWNGKVVFLAALTMSKLHDWRGALPKDEFTPEIITVHLGLPPVTVCHCDTPAQLCHCYRALQDGIEACARVKLIEDDGSRYVIRRWQKYQPDPTSAERQRKRRAEKKRNAVSPAVTDVTARDGTYGTESPLTPPPVGASSADASPEPDGAPDDNGERLRPREVKAVKVILDRLCLGPPGTPGQMAWAEERKRYRANEMTDAEMRQLHDRYAAKYAESIKAARFGSRKERR